MTSRRLRPLLRASAVTVTALALVLGAGLTTTARADGDDVLTGACDVALDVHRVGNRLDITTDGGICVTSAGVALVTVEGSVEGVIGWTCAGGLATGAVTLTVDHDDGPTVADDVPTAVSSVAGAVTMELFRDGSQDVVGEATLVELVTGPISCLVNNEFAVWRGPLTFGITG